MALTAGSGDHGVDLSRGTAVTTDELHEMTDDRLLDLRVELERVKAEAEELLLARMEACRIAAGETLRQSFTQSFTQ